jgi:hypothetical protein
MHVIPKLLQYYCLPARLYHGCRVAGTACARLREDTPMWARRGQRYAPPPRTFFAARRYCCCLGRTYSRAGAGAYGHAPSPRVRLAHPARRYRWRALDDTCGRQIRLAAAQAQALGCVCTRLVDACWRHPRLAACCRFLGCYAGGCF